MMLQALIAYAERNQLGDADFETVGVRWLISLDQHGKLAGGPIALAENPDDKKPRPKIFARPFTSPNELNQGTKSHFLCDTLERAVLFLDPKTSEKAEARRVQHAYFQKLLEEAAAACPDVSSQLQLVLSFLRNEESMGELHRRLVSAKAKPSDNATFSVDGANLLDANDLKNFWRNRRQCLAAGAKARPRRICVATGDLAETLDTTEKIKGVPGGLATGTNLISFDKDSFCSFGLDQAQNAALSAPAELKIRSALNKLIEISRGQGLVFNTTIHLHWTRKPVAFDPMDILAAPDENGVQALIESVRQGRQILGLDANAYYAMSLSGNGARIIVRDWLESTVPEVQRNIADWFCDLTIAHPDGVGLKRDFKLFALLYGMVRADLEEISPQIPTQLLHCALRGRSVPLPQAALSAAIRRQHLEENKLNPARIALIRACLIRSPNRKETDSMTEKLDLESKDPAYLCGQLFAVIGRLQLLALGKVGASLADRTYGGVATRPATTFGPVFTKLPAYLKKANSRFPGSGTNKQKELEILCHKIEVLGGIPQILGLEDQGRFALGFYCQLAQYRTDRAEAEAAKKAEELADESN
ncbi:MAG: type I-C CRISPR-associated protein Cas8c/Csd1 [Verrucomicrobiota bacterium]|jgi:CRISPR-associated protein Csd1